MQRDREAFWNILGATLLLGLAGGLALFATEFVLLWVGASLAWDAGWLPEDRDPVGLRDLVMVSALLVIPPTIAAAIWVYRRIVAADRDFTRAERDY